MEECYKTFNTCVVYELPHYIVFELMIVSNETGKISCLCMTCRKFPNGFKMCCSSGDKNVCIDMAQKYEDRLERKKNNA